MRHHADYMHGSNKHSRCLVMCPGWLPYDMCRVCWSEDSYSRSCKRAAVLAACTQSAHNSTLSAQLQRRDFKHRTHSTQQVALPRVAVKQLHSITRCCVVLSNQCEHFATLEKLMLKPDCAFFAASYLINCLGPSRMLQYEKLLVVCSLSRCLSSSSTHLLCILCQFPSFFSLCRTTAPRVLLPLQYTA